MKTTNKPMYNKNHFIIFDFETTGLTEDHEIIEYAFLEYKNNKLVDSITDLVKPTSSISEMITNITHITNQDVENKNSIEYHIDKIADFINNKDLVAHNVNFDLKFLNKILINKDVTINAIDSLQIMRKNIKLPKYNLDFLREYYKIDLVNHRAYDDCLIVKEILDKI